MRYLGYGIGHQNQDARWTQARNSGPDDDNMDVDVDPEEDGYPGGATDDSQASQIQGLTEMAMKMATQTAGDNDEEIHSDEDSDNEGKTSDEGDLFYDDDEESSEDDHDFDFGPNDGESEDDEEVDSQGNDYF